MKTSELIGELAEVIEKYGDLPAYYFSGATCHEPAVISALHRTGNQTWIWENIPPLTDEQVDEIMAAASAEAIDKAWSSGATNRRMIAAYLKATAHLDVQPSPLVNPINKALLEALKKLVESVENSDTTPQILKFAKQAISEAEKGLGENLGSPVTKGSDTEVRRNSIDSMADIERSQGLPPIDRSLWRDGLLQTLRDIQAEADNQRHDVYDRLVHIRVLISDVLAKAEGR